MQFENLDVWQRSADLACEVYLHFKLSKEFGLKDQITRSALSISSNIAECSKNREFGTRLNSIANAFSSLVWS